MRIWTWTHRSLDLDSCMDIAQSPGLGLWQIPLHWNLDLDFLGFGIVSAGSEMFFWTWTYVQIFLGLGLWASWLGLLIAYSHRQCCGAMYTEKYPKIWLWRSFPPGGQYRGCKSIGFQVISMHSTVYQLLWSWEPCARPC